MASLGTVLRVLSTGGLNLIQKDGEAVNSSSERNYCLCCGQLAKYYGTSWIGTNGSGDCSREVCVLCLESGCWGRDGKGCFGHELAQPAGEFHRNCEHDKAQRPT